MSGGIHSLVFTDTWNEANAREATDNAARLGFDLIEVLVTDFAQGVAMMTKKLPEHIGIAVGRWPRGRRRDGAWRTVWADPVDAARQGLSFRAGRGRIGMGGSCKSMVNHRRDAAVARYAPEVRLARAGAAEAQWARRQAWAGSV
jgi:hypothetical protein